MRTMSERIIPYEEREKMKEEGWDHFNKATTPQGKASGILRVCEAHYWRQREVFEDDPKVKIHTRTVVPKKYSPGYILDIDHYTPHWMFSMRDKIPDDVMKALEDNWGYKPTKSKYLPDKHSLYVFDETDQQDT